MAKVGESLAAPEAGWKRIDDTDSNLTYVGIWTLERDPKAFNSTGHFNRSVGAECRFNFTGSKLRLIGYMYPGMSTDVDVYIDGSKVGKANQSGSQLYFSLDIDITNAEDKEHCVRIVNNLSSEYYLDAIDIDEKGELKPYSPGTPSASTKLTADPGDTKVTLAWTAVTDATAYNVKRSTTAGGAYTTIASNVSGTNYVDTAVKNGSTYYYVVTAITASGESGNSNEASATPNASVTPTPTTGNQLLRVTVIDSSDHDFQLTSAEIDAFVSWFMKHTSTDTAGFLLTKKVGTQSSKEYVAFDKIISFEIISLAQ